MHERVLIGNRLLESLLFFLGGASLLIGRRREQTRGSLLFKSGRQNDDLLVLYLIVN